MGSRGDDILERLCLTRVPRTCLVHPGRSISTACSTCGENLLCDRCVADRHGSHATYSHAYLAPRFRHDITTSVALAGDQSGDGAPVRMEGSGETAAPPVVLLARRPALRTAAELELLHSYVAAAKDRVSSDHAAVVGASSARYAALCADIDACAIEARARLEFELARCDTRLESAEALCTSLVRAADDLEDIDLVAHGDTLLERLAEALSSIDDISPVQEAEGASALEATFERFGLSDAGLASLVAALGREPPPLAVAGAAGQAGVVTRGVPHTTEGSTTPAHDAQLAGQLQVRDTLVHESSVTSPPLYPCVPQVEYPLRLGLRLVPVQARILQYVATIERLNADIAGRDAREATAAAAAAAAAATQAASIEVRALGCCRGDWWGFHSGDSVATRPLAVPALIPSAAPVL
jgi:hypothetical protein